MATTPSGGRQLQVLSCVHVAADEVHPIPVHSGLDNGQYLRALRVKASAPTCRRHTEKRAFPDHAVRENRAPDP